MSHRTLLLLWCYDFFVVQRSPAATAAKVVSVMRPSPLRISTTLMTISLFPLLCFHRLFYVGDQVIDLLYTHRQSQEGIRYADSPAFRSRDFCVGSGRGSAYGRLNASQAHGGRDHPQSPDKAVRICLRVVQ